MIPSLGEIGDAEVAALLGGVGRDRTETAGDDFASVVWSCLVEPGDLVGGVLRAAFGPSGALDVLRRDGPDVVRALVEAGFGTEGLDIPAAKARWAPRLNPVAIRSALRAASIAGARLLLPGDPAWPTSLDELGLHAPATLWIRGDASALSSRPSVALVGSRASSNYGEQVATELGTGLVLRGFGVVSGGAYGIDGVAHRAALASSGLTVAIMAGGVDRFYPAGHHDLLVRVAETGAVVSEVPCGTVPSRWRFLQRNRVIAALTAATVVVEAGHRSGALNTAGHARSLGRPLGAVPGPITSPSSAGCHRLLRDPEVVLVQGVDDIVGAASPDLVDTSPGGTGRRRPAAEHRVLDALSGRQARHEDRIERESGLTAAEVQATLAVLELAGQVEERERGWVRLVR
ncbi:DNA-processing protein DprA [Frondihabitans sp. 4ASC-45]|uniref:DNA-processing protein DprA n=1 Tax=Frondihabitans sp. 4ASC-45 TaxID=3111636 RepID=UPI003C1B1CB0